MAQTSSLVAVFLASLGQMGGNACIAGRLLKGLSESAPGRVALRSGTHRWHGRASMTALARGQSALEWAAATLLSTGGAATPSDPMPSIPDRTLFSAPHVLALSDVW